MRVSWVNKYWLTWNGSRLIRFILNLLQSLGESSDRIGKCGLSDAAYVFHQQPHSYIQDSTTLFKHLLQLPLLKIPKADRAATPNGHTKKPFAFITLLSTKSPKEWWIWPLSIFININNYISWAADRNFLFAKYHWKICPSNSPKFINGNKEGLVWLSQSNFKLERERKTVKWISKQVRIR